ncbi:MAG: hypothetical protein IK139_05950, partial [Lachnospiraceae bacterium]|nr:hypothetical protein [Lachnospiraceae bacterium]
MRRKRFRSVLAMALAISMIFGSNASILADEVSGNTAPAEESITQPPASEEIQEPEEQTPEGTDEGETQQPPANPVQEEQPAGETVPEEKTQDAAVSSDSTDNDTVSENAEDQKAGSEDAAEEPAGAGEEVKLFVSGDTVSYNGAYRQIMVSSNVTGADGYKFTAWLVSADTISKPGDYSTDYYRNNGISSDFTPEMSSTAKGFTVSAANAGKYGVYVAVEKNGSPSADKIVFLSINKAAPISISVDSCSKYYDGTALLPGKAYESSGKELYTNAIKNKNDIDLIKVSGSQNDAGESPISVDVSELEKNYEKVTVSAGKLSVLSINLIIRSKDLKKNYDKKAVTDAERKGFTIEAPGADSAALTKTLSLSVDDFDWDPASLISGDTVTYISNNFSLNSSGEKKLYGAGGEKKKNFARVKLEPGFISIRKKEHEWTSNALTAPVINSINMNAKGFITIKWKAAKTYKDRSKRNIEKTADEKKMDQARYMIYRYDDVNEEWILLNGANRVNENKKAADIKFGQTELTFVDKQAGREARSTYIYKVNVIGYDENGKYGKAKEASYMACRPVALSLATMQHDPESLDLRLSKIRGSKDYVIERSLTGKKNDFDERATVPSQTIKEIEFSGAKLVSPLSYKNDGNLVKAGVYYPAEGVSYTDRPLGKGTVYYYRAYVKTEVVDFAEDGSVLPAKKAVESKVSDVLKAKCRQYAPYIITAGSERFNQTAVAFEKLSDDIIPIGPGTKYSKNKYEILRADSPTGGYKVVATVTGRDLFSDEVANLTEVPANKEVSLNGVKYKVPYPSYIYLVKGVAPEITYYYKVRVVLDKATGVASDPVSVKPVLEDVSSISANVDNYNQVTVSTDFVAGAKQMVITYRATKTHTGEVLSENTCKDSTWKRKTFNIKRDANNDPITKFTIGGLKHGYTYVFYAEPKNGKKHPAVNPKTASAKTKVGAPKITTAP